MAKKFFEARLLQPANADGQADDCHQIVRAHLVARWKVARHGVFARILTRPAFGQRIEVNSLAHKQSADARRSEQSFVTGAGQQIHVEIHNVDRQGDRRRPNGDCWTGAEYIGGGGSAHSDLEGRRFWNGTDLDEYLKCIRACGHARAGEECLPPAAARGEALWLGLRTCEGVCLSVMERERLVESDLWRRLQAGGRALLEFDRLRLTEAGFAVADALSLAVVDVIVEDDDIDVVDDAYLVPAGTQRA